MKTTFIRIVGMSLFAGFVFLAVLPIAQAKVAVTFVEAPDQKEADLMTVRLLVETELEKAGLVVLKDPRLPLVSADRQGIKAFADANKVDRVYEMNFLPMGKKLIFSIAERNMSTFAINFSEKLTASSIEEMDVVVPRLVKAILSRSAIAQTAEINTVTNTEARSFRKKAGEFLWGFSLMVGTPFGKAAGDSYGAALKFSYEMPHVRLDFDIGGMGGEDTGGHMDLGIRANYLFLTGNISPFVGGGMGFLLLSQPKTDSRAGVSFSANLGVEFFRLYHVRLIAEVEALFPAFRLDEETSYVGAETPTAVKSRWAPIGLFKLSLLW